MKLSGLAVCVLLAAVPACNSQPAKSSLNYTEDARKAYEEAMEKFRSHDWLECQQLFREVRRKYGYSKYARLAELRISDADFEQDKFTEAVRGYRQFVHDHRSDVEEVGYARARIAEAQYREIGEGVLLPSADERDQAPVKQAYVELRSFLTDYPDSKEALRTKELLIDVTARLIRHEIAVARFYVRRDNYLAAQLRVEYALRTYGPRKDARLRVESGLEPEAYLLLGEVCLRLKKWQDARDAFATILREFEASAYTKPAQNYLDYMRSQGV